MARNPQTRIAQVDPDNVTFGVEIECFIPDYHRLEIGRRHHGLPLPPPFPYGWLAEKDGSLKPDNDWLNPVEIVSPKLCGRRGLDAVAEMYAVLGRLGARVNATCGLHVHIGMRSVLGDRADEFGLVVRWVRRLLHLVSVHEPALYAISGDPARPNSEFCRSIKPKWHGKLTPRDDFDAVRRHNAETQTTSASELRDVSRYCTLNLCNLFEPKCTVEFRAFAATLDPLQAIGCITTALGLCHRAASCGTSPNYDAAPPDWRQAESYVRQMQSALWFGVRRYGWPAGAWEDYGLKVIGQQITAARSFRAGLERQP